SIASSPVPSFAGKCVRPRASSSPSSPLLKLALPGSRPRRERAVSKDHDAFAERDAFGLTEDDWASYLGHGPEHYSGPALLFWALGGRTVEGAGAMKRRPFPDILASIEADARVLAELASTSLDTAVRSLGPALRNLHRRIAATAEMAVREDDLK